MCVIGRPIINSQYGNNRHANKQLVNGEVGYTLFEGVLVTV